MTLVAFNKPFLVDVSLRFIYRIGGVKKVGEYKMYSPT
jgi:hypothetical protein